MIGISFYGCETVQNEPVCSWAHPPSWFLEVLKREIHLNTVRIPFSYENACLHKNWACFDQIVSDADKLGLSIILDYHRGWADHQGPQPDSEGITMDMFQGCWLDVLYRYEHLASVFAVGIYNEYQDKSNFQYLRAMHLQLMNKVEEHFPQRFDYMAGGVGWGGNMSGMRLSDYGDYGNRTYIEAHKYRFSGASNFADWEISMPHEVPPHQWVIGETGFRSEDKEDVDWAVSFFRYLRQRTIYNVIFWTIAHSYDTGGIFKDDCETLDFTKVSMLNTFYQSSFKSLRPADRA